MKNILRRKNIRKDLKGSALIFTMFIMAGMLIVAMSGAYLIFTGILASGVQSQSTKAYFAAEAGAERILWDYRKADAAAGGSASQGSILRAGTLGDGITFRVYYTPQSTLHNYTSIGSFNNIKRSVEVSF